MTSFNPGSGGAFGLQNSPYQMGGQGFNQAFQNFMGSFGQSQGLQNFASQLNPGSVGGQAFGTFLEDWQKSNQAMGANFARGLAPEQGMMQALQGLQGQGNQFAQDFTEMIDTQADQVLGGAEQNLADLTDWINNRYGEAKGYFDEGIATSQQAIDEYGENQAALWSSQALAAQQGFENSLEQINMDPNLTPEMRAQAVAGLRHQTMQQTQAMIAPLQARVEDVTLQAQQQLAGLQMQAGGQLGQLGVSYGSLLNQGQQGLQQARQFVSSLKTQGRLQAENMRLQTFQMQMAGYGQLAQTIRNNPLMFAAAGPVAMGAINLAQLGFNPFQRQGGGGPPSLPTEFIPMLVRHGLIPGSTPNDLSYESQMRQFQQWLQGQLQQA